MTTFDSNSGSSRQSWKPIEAGRLRRVRDLALPLVAAAIATNLMGIVDTLMVSQLGDAAIGGVGISGQLFFLLLAVTLGLAAGVQSMVARHVGEQRLVLTGKVLNAGALIAIVIGVLLVGIGYAAAPSTFSVLNTDGEVATAGRAYLNTRIPSVFFIAINIAFRSYWVGVNLAKWSMVSIVALSLTNVLFNYMLIFGNFGAPELGVAGAGLGSTLATLVGLLINIALALKLARPNGFLDGLPQPQSIKKILEIAYPESIRQVFFTIGVVLMYALIGQIGTRELAAFHVVISICLLAYMPHVGFGGAATTLVGEALGRKDAADAKLWGWQISSLGFLALAAIGLLVGGFPVFWLKHFLNDPETMSIAILPLQLAVAAHVLDGYGKVLSAALIGAGATRVALQLTLWPQWLLLLPTLAAVVRLDFGLVLAMGALLSTTLITALLFANNWHRDQWSSIAV